jgi:outer membrane protein assembly factor BamE|tara:strand:- start:1069 stop:1572 length:504 start_codon:yes stop_codon:yes gene_type:complete
MNNSIKPMVMAGLACLALALSACGNIGSLDFPGVYKIGIPQGNIITQEMVDQLRPGMTKRQVIFVMGTPLVRDPFNQNRWDYIYSYQPGGGERGQERISVFFEDDALNRFAGDFSPTEDPIDDISDDLDDDLSDDISDDISEEPSDDASTAAAAAPTISATATTASI